MLLIMKWTSGTFSFFSTFERIAKKMLLAQIKANYSSDDDISSDEETQESESEGDKEVKQGNEDNGTDENGKSFFFFLKWHIFSFRLVHLFISTSIFFQF